MGAPWFDRQDETDVVESGIYKVASDKQVRKNYPLKAVGTTSGSGVPAYTKSVLVEEYSDVTSVAACIGVSDSDIPIAPVEGDKDFNIEFRHYERSVAVCKFGVRLMVNKEGSADAPDSGPVAPYPGGFVNFATGMQLLGTVKRGPIAAGTAGMILVNVLNIAPLV